MVVESRQREKKKYPNHAKEYQSVWFMCGGQRGSVFLERRHSHKTPQGEAKRRGIERIFGGGSRA